LVEYKVSYQLQSKILRKTQKKPQRKFAQYKNINNFLELEEIPQEHKASFLGSNGKEDSCIIQA